MAQDSPNMTTILTPQDSRFPERLRTLPPSRPNGPGAPERLYLRGNLDLLSTACVAIIGTRSPTEAASVATYRIAFALAQAGITVVSGLAQGIDTQAHQGALDANGHTIAVLGTPLSQCYPKENAELMEAIAQRGLLLTEYHNRAFAPTRFVDRDRLQAALAHGVVVVQTKAAQPGEEHKPGTLYTVDAARALGRLLMVPIPRQEDYEQHPDLYAGGMLLLEQGLALRLSTATLSRFIERVRALAAEM